MATIATIKIHPAIGIARVGNSPAEFFIGPETPGDHAPPPGGYKDSRSRITRQAARFRLFGYDARGRVVGEITTADARITWTAHLVNAKAAWKQFDGLNPDAPLRNAQVTNRRRLVIDPGPRSLTGPNQTARFDTGSFLGVKVPLGEMRTDRHGRLLVLGGFGRSASPAHAPLTTFANNDGWHDDVSDGPITATITLKGHRQPLRAIGAWLICAPPDFAPSIDNVITLYDTLEQVAVNRLGVRSPAQPSFVKDIYPLLQRAMSMRWVSAMVMAVNAHTTFADVVPPPGSPAARAAIFARLRDPQLPPDQESESDMPMIWSDHYEAGHNQPLTRRQYRVLEQWKDGDFISDWPGTAAPSDTITPDGLDRAALERCVGAAFYPGIEASWLLRDVYTFSEPFRLDHAGLRPGDVTKQLAVPWQADFYDCAQEGDLAWWPGQRPDDVFLPGGGSQVKWTRGLVTNAGEMVARWHRLGFVVKRGGDFVETERDE